MAEAVKEWFETWFGSRYYDILYQKRDNKEAKKFIGKLVSYLEMKPGEKVLDIPCGKGRHSITLSEKGLKVTGVDLSKKSIAEANSSANDNLSFFIHDMRDPVAKEEYDYLFNLFTSFGYFSEEENKETLKSFRKALKPDGVMVLDFMNTHKVLNSLIPSEKVRKGDLEYFITREVENGEIVKTIRVIDKGEKAGEYTENVKILHKDDFLNYFKFAGLVPVKVFGSYKLEAYDQEHSDRMIFVLKKS